MLTRNFARRLILAGLLAMSAAGPLRAQDAMARGRYLAILGDCAGCHTVPHGAAYAGGLAFTAQFGTLYSSNITPDKQTGIGNWTGAQFYRALHEGIAADGHHLYPAFPYAHFTQLGRADTDALFAFLKTLKPVRSTPPPNRLYFPFNIRAMMTFWDWLFLKDARFQPDPSHSPAWNRGAFLVLGLGHCAACHTPKNILFGDEDVKALTGAVVDNWFSANLTGNRHAGLGQWSAADVAEYLKTGRNRYATAAGSMQEKVSGSTSRMTDTDRDAIAVYLKSLPGQRPAAPQQPPGEAMQAGRALFVASCAQCHQPPGHPQLPGVLPDYPKLAGDTLVMGRDPTTVVRIILEGAASPVTANAPNGYSMPGFAALRDEDIAALATYIRNAWGNSAPAVKASQVTALRPEIMVRY